MKGGDQPPVVPFSDLTASTEQVRAEVEEGWAALMSSNRWIGGEAVDRFEQQWASYCGTAHAVGVANGTDALQLILRALGIGPGDEVLVPANTFIATPEAVLATGARPRFVDVDPDSLLVTPEIMEAAVTPATSAVVPVHLFGHVADLAGMAAMADRHGLALVEDAAQAHGAERDGMRAGSIGRAAGFSFYPGKNLGAFGDAGAVTTDDAALAEAVRSLGNHGRSEGDRYVHPLVGINSRLDPVQAVALSAKLRHLDEWTNRRRKVVAAYQERTGHLPLRIVTPDPWVDSAWHLLVARVHNRDDVQRELAARGVQTGIHYPVPCHEQPGYTAWSHEPCPTASTAAREILSLPLHPHMDVEAVDRVCEALEDVLVLAEDGHRGVPR